MVKIKSLKRMALIMTLSAACVASTACSYTKKPEQTESSVDEQTKEIVINGTDLSVDDSKDLETNTPTMAETWTADTPAQDLHASNTETSVVPDPSANSVVDSSNTEGAETGITTNNDMIQPGDSKTINGFQTVDGDNVPITATFSIVDIQRGENAYTTLQSSNSNLPKPDNGMEYIIVTFNVSYDNGEADTLDMSENEASLVSERRVFALSNGDSNAEQVTANLDNSIYNLSIKKGESGQGAVAFLHKADSTEPLNFIGFGNIIKFNVAK